MPAPEQLLAVARRELGTLETPAGSNRTKYGDWYGMQAAWCGMFVSWCAHVALVEELVPRFAYTPAGAGWFQQRAQWAHTPAAGDIAFYDLSGMGRISHCGIVEAVLSDGSWLSIEGNTDAGGSRTGGSVRRQHRTKVGTIRGGFGRPRWSWSPPTTGPFHARPLLRRGSAGDAVRALQGALSRALSAQKLPPLVMDGSFGPATLQAVVIFQRAHGLAVDGVVGPATWAALAPWLL